MNKTDIYFLCNLLRIELQCKGNRQCDITLEEHLFVKLFQYIFVPSFGCSSLEFGPQKVLIILFCQIDQFVLFFLCPLP